MLFIYNHGTDQRTRLKFIFTSVKNGFIKGLKPRWEGFTEVLRGKCFNPLTKKAAYRSNC